MPLRTKWIILIAAILVCAGLVTVVVYLRMRSSSDLVSTPSPAAIVQTQGSSTQATTSTGAESNGTIPAVTAPAIDSDGDGLSDDRERTIGTNPFMRDTDGDGVSDGDEVDVFNTDPLRADVQAAPTSLPSVVPAPQIVPAHAPAPTAEPSRTTDTDKDGLSDWDEINKYHTDATKKDTDGDGYDDGMETKNGYNPLGSGKCAKPDCSF